jgi:hypothetical protein
MAVNTTMIRGSDNRSLGAWMNIYLTTQAVGVAGQTLTLAGDLIVTILHELPNFGWKVRVTTTPPGNTRLRVKKGDTVVG